MTWDKTSVVPCGNWAYTPEQLYSLLGEQVKSYHKHCRMGENTSVSMDLARELLESVRYTLMLAGNGPGTGSLSDMLRAGQEILEKKLCGARTLLHLVTATAPTWQTESRWETITGLKKYLDNYDLRHLAHLEPDTLYYPIPVPVSEQLRGIHFCEFYLNILWTENQIMEQAGDAEDLWNRLSRNTQNQCEQLIVNGIGRLMVGAGLESWTFQEEMYESLVHEITGKTQTEMEQHLTTAAKKLCGKLCLKDAPETYVLTVAQALCFRFSPEGLWRLFL